MDGMGTASFSGWWLFFLEQLGVEVQECNHNMFFTKEADLEKKTPLKILTSERPLILWIMIPEDHFIKWNLKDILLIDEILHHLESINLVNNGITMDNLPTNWGMILSINSRTHETVLGPFRIWCWLKPSTSDCRNVSKDRASPVSSGDGWICQTMKRSQKKP